jgi:hypothetical protein
MSAWWPLWYMRRRRYIRATLISSNFWTAAATVVIALFTVELYCVSSSQWKTMQQQLNDSEAVQAASVEIQNFRSEGTLTDGAISFDLKNMGQTRADEVVNTTFNGGYDPRKEVSSAKVVQSVEAEPNVNGYSIAPDAPARHVSLPLKWIVPQNAVAKVQSGELGWKFGVSIAYRDVFGRVHHTTDCLAYNVKAGFFMPCVGGQVRK